MDNNKALIIKNNGTSSFKYLVESNKNLFDKTRKEYGERVIELIVTPEEIFALRWLPYNDVVQLIDSILKNPLPKDRSPIDINTINLLSFSSAKNLIEMDLKELNLNMQNKYETTINKNN